ncbi:iron ABC transporter substrate-binding protein [Herbaspirillum seropedicae]|uniref:ABC-type Fe3+-hydroxamate transport system, periplasmic component protein n=1 Tax=Herbaspirillum seropedicae (strain SmR1) TaxID=757424 RepID=D8IVP5_HERSS|nr:ABC-type Fe3+-hydroxamate transport system, periplasmic component protein [Herbaspirillum seropedicae SmR1]AKN67648.1 iron ABC transporter substrate-binding protein [Herbaspirillum seropedicae]
MTFRRFVSGLAIVSALLLCAHASARVVTDLAGRQVELPDHPQRVLLGEGRFVFAMALLDRENPIQRIIGWQGELKAQDPYAWGQLLKRFPQAGQVPLIGKSSEASVSPEKIVSLRPDLAIFGLTGHGPTRNTPMLRALHEAGIPVIFIDFRDKPLLHTVPSMKLLGQALGREKEAEQYIEFYQSHLEQVRQIVAPVPQAERPRVFVEMLAGVWPACCHTTGNGSYGDMVQAAGGVNIVAGLVPGALGDVSMEYLLSHQPDIYIATGSRSEPGRDGLLIGPGATAALSASSLSALLARPGIRELEAVKSQRAFGIWHAFYNSPYNVLAVEALAKWFYPQRAAALHPEATQAELYRRFLSVDGQGTYWTAPAK